MKRSLAALAFCVLFFAACEKEPRNNPLSEETAPAVVDDNPSIADPYGTWKFVSRENFSTNEVFYKDADVSRWCNGGTRPCDVILTFAKGDTADIISGHTITNIMGGAFLFDPATRRFTTLSFGGTKVGEPRWSQLLWDNMYQIEQYSVNQRYLRLFFDAGQQSLTFERQ